MKSNHLMPGALALLTLALVFNGAARLLTPGAEPPVIAQPASAQGPDIPPGIYYLGRDTYFLTSSADGEKVYLWYYDFSPIRRENALELVTTAAAR
jgi:hypothetical protein